MARSRRLSIAMMSFAALAIGAAALAAAPARAKVSSSEAAKLGGELTPMGGIKAGNADGSIPAWTGGVTSPPPGYSPGSHHVDPFSGDSIQFTIDSGNVAQYRDRLSPGQAAMFARYPDSWRMNVYPARRSASYPRRIYDATIENATRAELTEAGNGVRNAAVGVPFPIPRNGLEAIWNHLLRYRGEGIRRLIGQVSPTAGGAYNMVRIRETILFPYVQPNATTETINNRLAYFLQSVESPPRLAGTILLVHETLDQKLEPRLAWTYNPGQRRVRRAPNIAYDNPGTAADGQRTTDNFDMFSGAPDRYNWELKGRREMYVPYNAYKLHSSNVEHDDLIQAGHVNPDFLRYEPHRVWVVDATLKEGTSHIYARRTFYLDEDSWQILVVDQYDGRGEIWRVSEAYPINYYEEPLVWDTLISHYDLRNGRYLSIGFNNEWEVEDFGVDVDLKDFTPEALRRLGRR